MRVSFLRRIKRLPLWTVSVGILFSLTLPAAVAGPELIEMNGYHSTMLVPAACVPYAGVYGETCHYSVQYPAGEEYNSYTIAAKTFDSSWSTWFRLNRASAGAAMDLMQAPHLADVTDDAAFIQANLASSPVQFRQVDRADLPARALSCYVVEYGTGVPGFLSILFSGLDIADMSSLNQELQCLWRTGFWGDVEKITVTARFSFSSRNRDAELPLIRAEIARAFASLTLQ